MIKNLLLIIAVFSCVTLFSQVTIEADSITVENSGDAGDFEIVGYVKLTNNSAETKSFTWLRDEAGFVDGWRSSVCDKNQCYAQGVSTQTFDLAPGETGGMDLHMNPKNKAGEGFATISVTDDSDPDNKVLLTYNYVVSGSSRVIDFKLDYVKVFPNPATDFFTLSDVPTGLETISIYNILGKQVKTFNAVSNANYNVSDLAKGMYLVNLTNAQGENLNTIKVHKN